MNGSTAADGSAWLVNWTASFAVALTVVAMACENYRNWTTTADRGRRFANEALGVRMLIRDQRRANQELERAAAELDVPLAPRLDEIRQARRELVQSISPAMPSIAPT